MVNKPFGYFMSVDLYNVGEGDCHDLKKCFHFLMDLTDRLKMARQSPPFIFINDEVPDKAGISGWVPLIESGIQIHTIAPKRFISIDIYTCGHLDTLDIAEWCKAYFNASDVESEYMLRGTKYNN